MFQDSVVRNVSVQGRLQVLLALRWLVSLFSLRLQMASDSWKWTKWVHELIAVGMTRDVCRWMTLRQHRCDEETEVKSRSVWKWEWELGVNVEDLKWLIL